MNMGSNGIGRAAALELQFDFGVKTPSAELAFICFVSCKSTTQYYHSDATYSLRSMRRYSYRMLRTRTWHGPWHLSRICVFTSNMPL